MDVQATGEAFSTQKRISGYFLNFLFLWVIVALLDLNADPADQNQCDARVRIRIPTTLDYLSHITKIRLRRFCCLGFVEKTQLLITEYFPAFCLSTF